MIFDDDFSTGISMLSSICIMLNVKCEFGRSFVPLRAYCLLYGCAVRFRVGQMMRKKNMYNMVKSFGMLVPHRTCECE